MQPAIGGRHFTHAVLLQRHRHVAAPEEDTVDNGQVGEDNLNAMQSTQTPDATLDTLSCSKPDVQASDDA